MIVIVERLHKTRIIKYFWIEILIMKLRIYIMHVYIELICLFTFFQIKYNLSACVCCVWSDDCPVYELYFFL
jgi:hypothetical protein